VTMTIHQAAAALLRIIEAPRGSVNVVAQPSARGGEIQVLIEPRYVRYIHNVPRTFKGYRVSLEERPTIEA
jgi:hypothetical protein